MNFSKLKEWYYRETFFNRHLIYDLYNFSLCFIEESLCKK